MSGPFIKMVAQMAVQGFAVVGRAMITAYQQALQNAKAGGGAAGMYVHTKPQFRILMLFSNSLSNV